LTGLGFESARQLLSIKLSHLIIAVRSVHRGKEAADRLKASFPKATIEVWELDMSSYDSIQAFTHRAETELSRLDIVILNAGIYKWKFATVPSTGHEETIQINYLSTALLAILLLPVLRQKSPSGRAGRMTIVNSALAFTTKFKNRAKTPLLPSFDDPRNFDGADYYSISKLLGQMFLWKLVDYVSGEDVIVNMVDPGAIGGTKLGRGTPGALLVLAKLFELVVTRNLPDGAAAYTDASVMRGAESHGAFIMGWEIAP
jgi:NAD(P)-dependent dehydrogenase (short-subunit alcohol dehydrogenase family)